MEEQAASPPLVFLSYSHDDREHKAWVSALGTKLLDHHVEVICDQWDLGPGDDVPKFMEKSVKAARYVLMICTEPYVRKADDGKGGVGYEAMVVTGELVRDLGTSKFIPIIRQKGPGWVLPTCVSTRLAVNLSEGQEQEDAFASLLHKIHEKSRNPKPPLGPNPFAKESLNWEVARVTHEAASADSAVPTSTAGVMEKALQIIETGSSIAWRRYQQVVAASCSASLLQWRNHAGDPHFETKPDLVDAALQGVECFEPFVAMLVAAAESGRDGYSNQLSWIDQVVNQPGWDGSGALFHTAFPKLITFVAQALIGGMLVERGRLEDAHGLLTTSIGRRGMGEELPLFLNSEINGWPDSMNHTCTDAWIFLNRVMDKWPWVGHVFGSVYQSRVAVSGYYTLMNVLGFIKASRDHRLPTEPLEIRMPLCFCAWPDGIPRAGLDLLLRQRALLLRFLSDNGISESQLKADWPAWAAANLAWLGNVYKMTRKYSFPLANLPDALGRGTLSI